MAETLGEALIPVINKLQDIFSQVKTKAKLSDLKGLFLVDYFGL